MEEIWKDITGYEGKYQVSNYGRIKSLPITEGLCVRDEERILTPVLDLTGYYRVHLRRSNKDKRLSVHRLVAQAFIPNNENLKYVNHKDENKTNNRADNLEWCTAKYNTNYGTAKERRLRSFKSRHSRAINMYDLEWNFIKRYECLSDVKKDGFSSGNVHCCCNHINGYTQTKGYRFSYA